MSVKKIKKDEVLRSRVTNDFKQKVKLYAKRNSLNMSEVIEKALKELIEK